MHGYPPQLPPAAAMSAWRVFPSRAPAAAALTHPLRCWLPCSSEVTGMVMEAYSLWFLTSSSNGIILIIIIMIDDCYSAIKCFYFHYSPYLDFYIFTSLYDYIGHLPMCWLHFLNIIWAHLLRQHIARCTILFHLFTDLPSLNCASFASLNFLAHI